MRLKGVRDRQKYIDKTNDIYFIYKKLAQPLLSITDNFDFDNSTESETRQLLVDFYHTLSTIPNDFGQANVNALTPLYRLGKIRLCIQKGQYRKAALELRSYVDYAILLCKSERENILNMLKETLHIGKEN